MIFTMNKRIATFAVALVANPSFATNDPFGACCYEVNCEWFCDELFESDCYLNYGGVHWANLSCTDINCPDFTVYELGGCCYEYGDIGTTCVDVKEPKCNALGGVWNPGIYCDCDPCTPVNDGCDDVPRTDCVGRPQFQDPNYQLFGNGQIAVQTASPSILGNNMITVFDLSGALPLDQNTILARYSHPSWADPNNDPAPELGSIFGLAIDEMGNLFVSATKTWSEDIEGDGGWGAVYKIDTITALPSIFATIPMPNAESSLGSITYDCDHNQFFVSSFEDGLIYRLDSSTGVILDFYDHGSPYTGAPGPVHFGDRPWAVEVHDNKLHYSLWNNDVNNQGSGLNQIWSVLLDATGKPIVGTETLEIDIPVLQNFNGSSPVADIDFSVDGTMFLSERSQNDIEIVSAHNSRVLEYECTPSGWVLSPHTFDIGVWYIHTNAAGGVDATANRIWASGDALHFPTPDMIYGIQGLPVTGGDTTNSVLIDYQGTVNGTDKMMLGDLVCTDEDGGGELGVCCYQDNCESHCDVMNEKDCMNYFGSTFFPNTTCAQVNCPPPPEDVGACCYVDAGGYLCTNANMTLCDAIQGIWYPGIPCECIPCEPTIETGACCFLDTSSGIWTCYELTEEECADKPESTYSGDGTTCMDTTCCKPIGACCVAGNCLLVSVDQCSSANGFYYGDGVQCFVVDCSYCPSDLNDDARVNIDDLLILISAWGACP